ncbi:MAG: hydrogenase iron-sulfur subunit, partial [Syntrophomonadaceae bacterium]|nr:hydrogenase iron-sulfur subunit [Syntrophomonadaceae bacterium]
EAADVTSDGRFHVTLRAPEGELEEFTVGALVVVPPLSLEHLDLDLAGTTGLRVLVLLQGVTPGAFEAVLPALGELARENQVWLAIDDIPVRSAADDQACAQARQQGVVFLRPAAGVVVEPLADGSSLVRLQDVALDAELQLTVDRVVTLAESSSQPGVSRALLGLGPETLDGWPGRTNRAGIWWFPQGDGRLTAQERAQAVACIAGDLAPLARGVLAVGAHFQVDVPRCALCLTCYRLCPHRAVDIVRDDSYDNLYGEACRIDALACFDCGLCAAACPAGAISPAAPGREGQAESSIIACRNAAGPWLPGASLVPCAGAVNENDMLRALAAGGEGVEVVSCYAGKCQHRGQDARVRRRANLLNHRLAALGVAARVHSARATALPARGPARQGSDERDCR